MRLNKNRKKILLLTSGTTDFSIKVSSTQHQIDFLAQFLLSTYIVLVYEDFCSVGILQWCCYVTLKFKKTLHQIDVTHRSF